MEFRVEYHPAAERDLEAAIEYYAERVHRLGTAFHDEIRRIERLAIQHPQAGSHLGRDVRRLLLDRFPYAMEGSWGRHGEEVVHGRRCCRRC
jgi:plasmid stabilization system protein ParE